MAMPEILKKEYGPFSGLEWGVIIVGGVGLGLALRFYLNRRGGDQSAAPGSAGPTSPDYGVSTGVAPSSAGGTLYNQGEIVAGVLDAINAQKPPPAATTPEVDAGDNTDGENRDQPYIGIPRFGDGSTELDDAVRLRPAPKPKPSPPPQPAPSTPKWSSLINSLVRANYSASQAVSAGVGTTNNKVTRADWSKATNGDQSGVAAAVMREFSRLNLRYPNINRLIGLVREVRAGRNISGGSGSIRAGLESFVN